MIDFSKLSGENFWDQWYKKQTAPAPAATGQTSITKQPSVTVGNEPTAQVTNPATTTTTTGDTSVAQTSQPFTNYPSQWGTANNTYTDIANANPYDFGAQYNLAKQAGQYDVTDAIRQAVETAGMGGQRWSSSLGRTGQDIGARYAANLANQYAQNEMGGYQQNQQNRLGAASGLTGLGNMYAQLPMDVANNMMNMGSTMQNAYNQEISPYYNLWNSQQEYNSPWLSALLQSAQGSQPQTYNKSGVGQGLDAIMSFLPFLFL